MNKFEIGDPVMHRGHIGRVICKKPSDGPKSIWHIRLLSCSNYEMEIAGFYEGELIACSEEEYNAAEAECKFKKLLM